VWYRVVDEAHLVDVAAEDFGEAPAKPLAARPQTSHVQVTTTWPLGTFSKYTSRCLGSTLLIKLYPRRSHRMDWADRVGFEGLVEYNALSDDTPLSRLIQSLSHVLRVQIVALNIRFYGPTSYHPLQTDSPRTP
jgi:hypothetical protein